jgi:hypothetical protein
MARQKESLMRHKIQRFISISCLLFAGSVAGASTTDITDKVIEAMDAQAAN